MASVRVLDPLVDCALRSINSQVAWDCRKLSNRAEITGRSSLSLLARSVAQLLVESGEFAALTDAHRCFEPTEILAMAAIEFDIKSSDFYGLNTDSIASARLGGVRTHMSWIFFFEAANETCINRLIQLLWTEPKPEETVAKLAPLAGKIIVDEYDTVMQDMEDFEKLGSVSAVADRMKVLPPKVEAAIAGDWLFPISGKLIAKGWSLHAGGQLAKVALGNNTILHRGNINTPFSIDELTDVRLWVLQFLKVAAENMNLENESHIVVKVLNEPSIDSENRIFMAQFTSLIADLLPKGSASDLDEIALDTGLLEIELEAQSGGVKNFGEW